MVDQARREHYDPHVVDAAELVLGLGANLGEPWLQLRSAVAMLGPHFGPLRVSSVYRSEAVGHREQPDFLNLVCIGRSRLAPESALAITHDIEVRLGRRRSFPGAPREIDIDILAYGEEVRETPMLTLPHPRLHERGFVLHPLAEIAPGWRHPVFGLTAAELATRAGRLERVERVGELGAS